MAEQFGSWWPIIRDLLIFALWLHTWLNSRQAVTEKSIQTMKDEINKELAKHSDRITRQEQDMHHSLTKEDLVRVHERLDVFNMQLHQLSGEFSSHNKTLMLIHEVMISK